MYIYLIGNSERFKIGFSKNPEHRLKTLQTGNSENLILYKKYHSPKFYLKIEKALHFTYGHQNYNNEWFSLTIDEALMFENHCITIENNLKLINDKSFTN